MIGEIALLLGLWVAFLGGVFLFMRGSTLGQKRGDLLWKEESQESFWPNERRRYKRRYLPLSVSYASLDKPDLQGGSLTHDVGKGGIRFPATYPLRQGSRLYLSIDLPRKTPLSLFGEVVWQKAHPAMPSRYDTGIKFVDLSTSNMMRIARHL